MTAMIDILMATYNGERHIEKQIKTILNQSHKDFRLLIRDDGSTDKTVEIIKQFEKLDDRVIFIQDQKKNLGPCLNFKELLKYVDDSSYVMFSDQDDVWFEFKVEKTLEKMLEDENKKNSKLVYTNYIDMKESNEAMKLVYQMNMQSQTTLKKLLFQNWIMGCTMMINPKLASIAKEIPIEADHHDNWCALLASSCGTISYLHIPTMIHMTHSNNVTGQEDTTSHKNRSNRIIKRIKAKKEFKNKKLALSTYLDEIIQKEGTPEGKAVFNLYQDSLKNGTIKSVIDLSNNGYRACNKTQTLLFYYSILGKSRD